MNVLVSASRKVLSKYATFSGRASRPEYWWWILSLVILLFATQIIDGLLIAPLLGFNTFQQDAGQPLSFLAALGLILPTFAVGARRLHDVGKSGWWLLLALIPILGALALLYFHVQPSDETNKFGSP